MLRPTLKNPTTLSGFVWLRIHGVKLKLYSGSVVGRTFQPRVRSQKNGSPGLIVLFAGRFEIELMPDVAEVKVDGLTEVVCDRPEGSSVPYFVEGQSLSTMMSAPMTRIPVMPMFTSCSSA